MQALYENNAVFRSNLVSICGRRSLLKAHAYIIHVKSYNKTFQNACATPLNKSLLVQSYFVMVVFLKSRFVSFS